MKWFTKLKELVFKDTTPPPPSGWVDDGWGPNDVGEFPGPENWDSPVIIRNLPKKK